MPPLAPFARLVAHDVRLQYRHGFYLAYLVVVVFYGVALQFLPPDYRLPVAGLMIYSDPSVYGFFFAGAILLLERGDGTHQALFAAPVSPARYLACKTLSLGLLALLSSAAIALATLQGGWNPVLMAAGVVLTSFLFVLAGIIAATRIQNFYRFLVVMGPASVLFFIPTAGHFGLADFPLARLLPTRAGLLVVAAAMEPGRFAGAEVAQALAALAVWVALAWLWAHRWLRRYVVEQWGERA
ncbi:MAG: ABC transporter permease [bacterium]